MPGCRRSVNLIRSKPLAVCSVMAAKDWRWMPAWHTAACAAEKPGRLFGCRGLLRRGELSQWQPCQSQRSYPACYHQHPGHLCRRDCTNALPYGAQPNQTALFGISTVQDSQSTSGITSLQAYNPASESNPQLRLFGENCLTCHISAQPTQTGGRYDHFTGCSACHTPTQSTDLTSVNTSTATQVHKLTTAISYTQCDTCYNRGNYDLRNDLRTAHRPAHRPPARLLSTDCAIYPLRVDVGLPGLSYPHRGDGGRQPVWKQIRYPVYSLQDLPRHAG